VIPRRTFEVDSTIPEGHVYWVPRRVDIDEEGFDGFRDTWVLRSGLREARDVVHAERELIDVAGRLAQDPTEFEAIASALESNDPASLPERLQSGPEFALIEMHFDDVSPIGGLEIGVAGLSYAMAAVGCHPAASCRSHDGGHSWSERPVVFFAASRHRADVLAGLVRESGCGFGFDPGHSQLLLIEAQSIEEMARLATLVLEHRDEFVQRKGSRQPRGRSATQVVLDLERQDPS
jgi:hypothetical protein